MSTKRMAFVSDLHIEATRVDIAKHLKSYLKKERVNVLCFAGDLSKSVNKTATILKDIEQELGIIVKAIPGNHEMRDNSFKTSFEALNHFNEELGEISLMNAPHFFQRDWVIVGNMGWYDYSVAPLKYNDYVLNNMEFNGLVHSDKIDCDWGKLSNVVVADMFLHQLKDQLDRVKDSAVILLSHIVPYKEFLDYTISEEWSYWNSFVGNLCIGDLIDKYENIKMVHFGHTHKRYHTKYKGKHIICSSLGYESEWETKDIEEEIERAVVIYDFI